MYTSQPIRLPRVHYAQFQKRFSPQQRPGCVSAADDHFKIEVKGLSKKSRNGTTILDNVSFKVKTGGIHALVGPSGSGKSTILRALNRLWEPPVGTVFYDGCDIISKDVVCLRLCVGMVFQSGALFDGTVAENLEYGPLLQGIHPTVERMEELLQQAGILEPSANFLRKNVKELSGGESQRVALARTLANNPDVLLLDEPTSSLDPTSTRMVEKSIVDLVEKIGATVLLVSHDMEQVHRVAGYATVLGKGGLVVESGTPENLQRSGNPRLAKFFSGELHM